MMQLRTWNLQIRRIATMNERQAWEEIVREWRQIDKMKDLNQRLYDELGGCLVYVLEYAKKNNITLPNKDRLYRMVENLHVTCYSVMNLYKRINSSPKSEHPRFTPEDGTEPIFCIINCILSLILNESLRRYKKRAKLRP
jgi:hypothetical protein